MSATANFHNRRKSVFVKRKSTSEDEPSFMDDDSADLSFTPNGGSSSKLAPPVAARIGGGRLKVKYNHWLCWNIKCIRNNQRKSLIYFSLLSLHSLENESAVWSVPLDRSSASPDDLRGAPSATSSCQSNSSQQTPQSLTHIHQGPSEKATTVAVMQQMQVARRTEVCRLQMLHETPKYDSENLFTHFIYMF